MMEIYTKIEDWDAEGGSAFAMGRFDGVHIGHRAILEYTVTQARERGLTSVCFSFQEITFPEIEERGILTTSDEKAELLRKIGFDVLLLASFEPPLINKSAMDFINDLLVEKWNTELVVAGYDFHFGKDRIGDAEFLKSEGNRLGFDVKIFDPVEIDEIPVKATNIRNLIKEGKVREAIVLLGRPYGIHAKQIPGKGFGRTIGFPTINFKWPEYKVRPPLGVYAVLLDSDEFSEPAKGVANFGLGPTVSPDRQEPLLEVHVLDSDPQISHPERIYRTDLIESIRPEQKFSSVKELKERIAKDCDSARVVHGIIGDSKP